MYIYSAFGGENLSIRTRSRFLAEELIYAISTEDLIVYVDMSGCLEVMGIKNY
jgi:hypothetical protein